MAIRVRKLARRVGRSPEELLGVLQAIGVDRYRSPEDMLPGPIEQKLVAAVKQGIRPLPVEPVAERRAAPKQPPQAGERGLLDAVPRPADPRFQTLDQALAEATPTPPRAPQAPGAASAAPATSSVPDPSASPAETPSLAELRALLAAEREALRAEREALSSRLDALQMPSSPADKTSLSEVFQQRGLVGVDEQERAIRALAESRRLGEILPSLHVDDPGEVLRWLREVLMLVDGPPPEGLRGPMVTVSRERAEIPGAAEWRKLCARLSEQLLLHGARQVLVVGGPVRAHRLLANALDPRVELRFRPGARVVTPDAEADVQRTDAIALWGVELADGCEEVYRGGRAVVSRLPTSDLRSFLVAWARDLQQP